MARQVTKNYSNLTGGVSQQPAHLRRPSQCEEQNNLLSDLTRGLVKRPGLRLTEALAVASTNMDKNTLYTPLAESVQGGPYIMALTGDATTPIEIYETDGLTAKTVNYVDAAAKTYLTTSITDPQLDLRVKTVADTTFVTNRGVTPAMDSTVFAESRDVRDFNDGTYKWTVSPAQAGEYYLEIFAGGDPGIDQPADFAAEGVIATGGGTLGALAVGEWAWGDNDTLGYDTIYARITGDADPDTLTRAEGLYDEPWVYIWVKAGWSTTAWFLNVDGTSVTGAADTNTDVVADNIHDAIEAIGATYTVEKIGVTLDTENSSVLRVLRKDANDLAIATTITGGSSSANTAIAIIPGRVDSFSKLPPMGKDGDVVLIEGDDGVTATGRYYVRWQDSTGTWTETMAPLQDTTIDNTTMPIKITNTAGTFAVELINYDARQVGDNDTIPQPSFIGKRINDIFFLQNRLGLISDDAVILSRTDDFFNLWGATATDVLDDDPIDTAVQGNDTVVLYWAVVHHKQALLFGQDRQFAVGTGEGRPLTPSTAVVDPTTVYACSERCRPVAMGSNIYFVSDGISDQTGYAQVREYFVTPGIINADAANITQHAPQYLSASLSAIIAVPKEDMLLFIGRVPNAFQRPEVYVYQTMWAGDEKVQSAWSKWGDRIIETAWQGAGDADDDTQNALWLYGGAEFGDGVIHFIGGGGGALGINDTEIRLSACHLSDDTALTSAQAIPPTPAFFPHMDFLCIGNLSGWDVPSTASYVGVSGSTYEFDVDLYVPGTVTETVDWYLVQRFDWRPFQATLVSHSAGTSRVSFSKTAMDAAGVSPNTQTIYIGQVIPFAYELGRTYLHDSDGAVIQGDLRLLSLEVLAHHLSTFSLKLVHLNRFVSDTGGSWPGHRRYTETTREVAVGNYPIVESNLEEAFPEGSRKVYIFGDSRDLRVSLETISPHTLEITALSILCDYTPRSRIR